MNVRGTIAVGAAYVAAIAGPPAGAAEIAGHDVLRIPAAVGTIAGEANANNQNQHVRECADKWDKNIKAGEIVVSACTYEKDLSLGDKVPSLTPETYIAKHLLSSAQVQERAETFRNRTMRWGSGPASILVGGIAASALFHRRRILKDNNPSTNIPGPQGSHATTTLNFTVADVIDRKPVYLGKNTTRRPRIPLDMVFERAVQ